ncbi:hypothetical protein SLE2022_101410 [Rubroshorea leprosula]
MFTLQMYFKVKPQTAPVANVTVAPGAPPRPLAPPLHAPPPPPPPPPLQGLPNPPRAPPQVSGSLTPPPLMGNGSRPMPHGSMPLPLPPNMGQ